MEPFALTDGVVLLRTPDVDDIDRITELCQDGKVQAWTTMPSPYARSDADGFVTGLVRAGWASGSMCTWAIREAADAPVVGMIGLTMQDVGSAEIGYWLGPDARGRGVVGRSTDLVVDAAFGRLGLDRLFWCAFVGNWPSRRVVERAGFRIEGELRGGAVQRGVRRDAWVGSLLRADPRPVPADR